jgi:hypothetical protein
MQGKTTHEQGLALQNHVARNKRIVARVLLACLLLLEVLLGGIYTSLSIVYGPYREIGR